MHNRNKKYEDMSRDELLMIIGSDADEDMSHEDLVMMAMSKDAQA